MPPAEEEALLLRDAIRRLSDSDLVANHDNASAAFAQTGRKSPRPYLYAGASHTPGSAAAYIGNLARALVAAAKAMDDNFRSKIKDRQIRLVGRQVEPIEAESDSELPDIYVDEFRFARDSDTVTFSVFRYVKVRAVLIPAVDQRVLEGSGPPNAAPIGVPELARDSINVARHVPQTINEVEPGTQPTRDIIGPRQRGGRENYTPLIEEALRARWDDVGARIDLDGKFEATTIADMLRKWLDRKYPERSETKHLPTRGTIRIRVRKIYERLLNDKAEQ
jgi:hypothetical protein